ASARPGPGAALAPPLPGGPDGRLSRQQPGERPAPRRGAMPGAARRSRRGYSAVRNVAPPVLRMPARFSRHGRRLNLFSKARFLVRHLRDLVLVLLEQVLHLLLALVAVVLSHLLGLLGLVEVLVGVAADVAAGDLGLLAGLPDARRHLLPLLAAHRRHLQPDH